MMRDRSIPSETMRRVIVLAEDWVRHFPTLAARPDFLRTYGRLPKAISLEPRVRDDLPLPRDFRDLLGLHETLTLSLVTEHLLSRRGTGDFQTAYPLALEVTKRTLGGQEFESGLDPTCGTGAFLLSLLSLQSRRDSRDTRIVGVERNPESASVAWFLCSIARDLLSLETSAVIECADVNDFATHTFGRQRFDVIVGNPPWVTWTDLSHEDKRRWTRRDLRDYEFVEGSGMERALGVSNKDVAPAIVLRVLQELGDLQARFGFLFKKGQMNMPAMRSFREGRIPHRSGRTLGITEVLVVESQGNFIGGEHLQTEGWIGQLDLNPAASILIRSARNRENKWQITNQRELVPRRVPSGDCVLVPAESQLRLGKRRAPVEIRHGVKHDCREVFEISEATAEVLEWECTYPVVKSRHVGPNGWGGEYDLLLLPNRALRDLSELEFSRKFPHAYRYLSDHKSRLEARKSQWVGATTFYDVFGVGDYTFKPYKVAWVRLGWKPRFVVLEPVRLANGERKPVIPSDHFLFIPTNNKEYAWRLSELLNSTPYQETLEILSPKGKSSLPKRLIQNLDLPSEAEFKKIAQATLA